MARKNKPRDFHEPWTATRCKTWEIPFRFGPPRRGDTPEELAENVREWHARRELAEKDADWIVWGSRVREPAVCTNLDGSITVMSDRRILTTVKSNAIPEESPSHEDFARRICACVNACAGIASPESFVSEVRALLKDLLEHKTDDQDPRILSLLARCIPLEELDFHIDTDEGD